MARRALSLLSRSALVVRTPVLPRTVQPYLAAFSAPHQLARAHMQTQAAVSDAEFQEAVASVQRLPSVSNDQKLRLYALFKQSSSGANSTPKPGMLDMVGRAKWTAWTALGDMSKQQAKNEYVALVRSLGADVAKPASASASAPASALAGDAVLVANEGSVRTITLNRPDKRNALTFDMYQRIVAELDAAARDASVRVCVLTGAGAFMSSGNDLANFTENMPPGGPVAMAAQGRETLQRFVGSFVSFPKILVIALNGPAVGIAVTTLPLADFVYASHKATLHAPLTALGQCAEGCSSVTFPRVMGVARANELLLAGRKLTAEEGQTWGLVSEVFEDSTFRAEVAKRVATLAALPPQAMQVSKGLIRDPVRAELEAANARECAAIEKRWLSEECMNAIMKFFSSKKK